MRNNDRHHTREHRRRRMRRHGRRAYIRSVYFLPSLATLGNAICGFAAIYVSSLTPLNAGQDAFTQRLASHNFSYAAYLIFGAMVFDALDGRLARFTRHTTDFGGQLDSLADVLSFGAAPAFIALQVFKVNYSNDVQVMVTRLIWAIGALYMSCAALRLARFNVSNEHGEQHHFSFLGMPSPAAGGTVASFVLMQQDMLRRGWDGLSNFCLAMLPIVVLGTGLLMISQVRYPHVVNRYLRGRKSMARLVLVVSLVLVVIVAHQYALGIGHLLYVFWGLGMWGMARYRRGSAPLPRTPPAT
jgi:CDP-diacylglycerol--serine O-phosphatidyltransferase